MDFCELEGLLDRKESVGFRKPTDDPEYLGWILVRKLEANPRLLELFDESEAPELVREERRRQHEPYLVLRIELKRSVHEAGDYETEQDYRQKEQLWFGSLADVEKQLAQWGYSLEDARNARELDAP